MCRAEGLVTQALQSPDTAGDRPSAAERDRAAHSGRRRTGSYIVQYEREHKQVELEVFSSDLLSC